MDLSKLLRFASEFFISCAGITSDQLDLIRDFNNHQVKYVVIGGMAMDLLGFRESSSDIDFFVESSLENSQRIFKALVDFGFPVRHMGVTPDMFSPTERGPAHNLRIGSNVEILANIKEIKIPFSTAWNAKNVIDVKGMKVNVLTPQGIATMKGESTRSRDKEDMEILRQKGISAPSPNIVEEEEDDNAS